MRVFAQLSNTIIRELGVVERLEAPRTEVINLEKAMCLSNVNVIYSTLGHSEPREGDWGKVTSRRRVQSEGKVFGMKKTSQIEAASVR